MSHDEVSSLRTELAFIRAEMTKLGAQAQVTQMAVADAAHDNVNMRQSVSLVIDLIDKFEGKLAALDVESDDTTPAAHHHVGFLAVLGLSAVMAMGCAHITPVVDAVEDCASPLVAEVRPKLFPAALAILACSGGNPVALAPCALAGLESLAASLGPDGALFVDCVVDAIANARSLPAGVTAPDAVQAQARLYLAHRARAGVVLRAAP